MSISDKLKVLLLAILFLFFNTTASFAERTTLSKDAIDKNFNPSKNWIQLAEIGRFESFVFNRDKSQNSANKRMTWEGVLKSDSPEKATCKKKCLASYGTGNGASSCDGNAWNNCMPYMDWGFLHLQGECKGDYGQKCKACWQKHTQTCYDKSFKGCLDYCK
jgi:hypothetical protein